MNLLDLVRKLKSDLLKASTQDCNKKTWISEDDIHKIRIAIGELDETLFQQRAFDFFSSCFDFLSIFEYFHELYPKDFFSSAVRDTFDPLLIYLKEKNYEIIMREVTPSDKISNVSSAVISNLEKMEEAYHSADYQRVTSLSITILQTLYKQICELKEIEYSPKEKHNDLYQKIKSELNLVARDYKKDEKLQKFCVGIEKINQSLNEIRNLYSESHGKADQDLFSYESLSPHHYKLIVDTTKTLVNFLVESYEYQTKDVLSI